MVLLFAVTSSGAGVLEAGTVLVAGGSTLTTFFSACSGTGASVFSGSFAQAVAISSKPEVRSFGVQPLREKVPCMSCR